MIERAHLCPLYVIHKSISVCRNFILSEDVGVRMNFMHELPSEPKTT